MPRIISYKGLKLTIVNILKYILKNKIFILLGCLFIFSSSSKNKEFIFSTTSILQEVITKIKKPLDMVVFSISTINKKYNFEAQEEELLKYKLQIELLQETNNMLSKQLKFANLLEGDFISARLLQINKKFGDETSVISCGKNHKVQVGDVVVSSLGLFGRIKEIFPNYSRVMMITNYDSRISFISSKSKERGIVLGYENKLHMKYLEENHELEEGEVLFTSGESDIIPYGIPIGIVKKKKNHFFAEPYIEKQNIELVYVYIRQ